MRVHASALGVSPAIKPRPTPLVASTSLSVAAHGAGMTPDADSGFQQER